MMFKLSCLATDNNWGTSSILAPNFCPSYKSNLYNICEPSLSMKQLYLIKTRYLGVVANIVRDFINTQPQTNITHVIWFWDANGAKFKINGKCDKGYTAIISILIIMNYKDYTMRFLVG